MGHKHDPLYQIRGLLRHGVEHLTEKQQAKISHCLDAGDPGRTLRAWRGQVLAYFDTSGVSSGGTDAINMIIKKIRRLAPVFHEVA